MPSASPQGWDALPRSRPIFHCLCALLILTTAAQVRGQAVWDGGGATGAWSEAANWGATVPANGGTLALQFGGTSQLAPNNNLTGFTASSLTFNAGAGAFVLGGNAISLAGNITNSSSSLQTINQGLTLAAASSINTGASGITLGGAVDGLFGITKQGTGTLTLNGANGYTGATSITAGTVVAGNNQAFGSTEAGTSVTAGATLILAGGVVVTGETLTINGGGDASNTGALRVGATSAEWAGNIVLGSGTGSATGTGGARLGVTGSGTLTVSGSITDGGGGFDLVIRSTNSVTGKVLLSGTGSSYGNTFLVVGNLQLGAANTLPTTTGLTLGNSSNQGATLLEMDGFDQQVGALSSAGGATTMTMRVQNSSATLSTLTVNNGSTNTYGGSLGGNLALVKTGGGNLVLNNAGGNPTNNYSGATTINQGSITMGKSSALGTTAEGTTVASGAALILTGDLTVGAEALSLTGTGISSGGALRAQTGTSSWAGLITLGGATEIQVDSVAALTLDVASGDAITGTNTNLTLDVNGTLTVADAISTGTGTFTKSGTGTATLGGATANTFTGTTTITGGVLVLGKTSGNALASTAITVGNGAAGLDVLRLGGSNQILDTAIITLVGAGANAGVFQLNGRSESVAAVISTGGAGIIENEGGTASTLTLTSTAAQTFSGIIRDGDGVGTDGSLSLVKTGNSVLTLSGANSHTGTTTINAATGTLLVSHATALGFADGTTATGTVVTAGRVEIGSGITVTDEVITLNGTGGDNNGALRAVGGGTGTWAGTIILASGTGVSGTRVGSIGANTTTVLSGQITDGAGSFDLAVRTDGSAGGKVVISGAGNDYRDTYIVVGTVQLDGGDDRLPTAGILTLGNASSAGFATFDLNGRSQRIGGLTSLIGAGPMPRTVTNSGAAGSVLTIHASSGATYGGDITGDLSLVKSGTASQVLNGTATHTGRTSVQAGTLTLSGSTIGLSGTSWIDISAGATLSVSGMTGGTLTYNPASGTRPISGGGSITGALTVGGVGFITPGSTSDPLNPATAGDGVGSLTISGNLTFNPTNVSTAVRLNISSLGLADQVIIGGNLTLNSSTYIRVAFDDPFFDPAAGTTWELLDWAGSVSTGGFSTGDNFRTGLNEPGNEGNLDLPELMGDKTWQISALLNGGGLIIMVTPEPGRALLLFAGIMPLLLARRRRGGA